MTATRKPKGDGGEDSISNRPSRYYSLDNPVDNLLCRAAAASSVLQGRHRIPEAACPPPSSTYDNMPEACHWRIYQTITASWTNKGGPVEQAYNWWFNSGGFLPPFAAPAPRSGTISPRKAATGRNWTWLQPMGSGKRRTIPRYQLPPFLGKRYQGRNPRHSEKQHQ